MTAPTQYQFEQGDLRGVAMDFIAAGDTLLRHGHPANAHHLTFVRRGAVRVEATGFPPVEARAGDLIDPGLEHEIVALEANTRILNLMTVVK